MRFQSHILSELDGRDYLKLSLSHLEEKIYIKILENIQTLFKTFDIFLYKITVYGKKAISQALRNILRVIFWQSSYLKQKF